MQMHARCRRTLRGLGLSASAEFLSTDAARRSWSLDSYLFWGQEDDPCKSCKSVDKYCPLFPTRTNSHLPEESSLFSYQKCTIMQEFAPRHSKFSGDHHSATLSHEGVQKWSPKRGPDTGWDSNSGPRDLRKPAIGLRRWMVLLPLRRRAVLNIVSAHWP